MYIYIYIYIHIYIYIIIWCDFLIQKLQKKQQFLDPEIVKMDQKNSGSRNCRNGAISGSRNRRKGRQILYPLTGQIQLVRVGSHGTDSDFL